MVELTSPRKIYPLPSRLWQGKVKLKRLRAESIHPLATTPQQSGATMRAKPKEPAQKKAYICHATGTEQSAQNLSATRPAMAICFCVHTRFSVTCAGFVDFGGTLWYFGGTAKVPSIGAQMLNISALKQTRFSFFQNGGMHHEETQ